MRQLQGRSFLKQGVAVAVAALMMGSAHAATDKDEVKKLREEVQALKTLILQQQQVQQQQQQVQSQQQVQLEQVRIQPAQVAATPAPKSASLLSKAGASVNLYGFIRADAEYQFKGGNGIFNRISSIDLNGVPDANGVINANNDRFGSSANTSRIGLDFTAAVQGADVGGKLEADFRGGDKGDTLRVRHAYMTYNNWLIGQTTSSFLSLDTQPEMIDYGTPAGHGTFRTPMVRYAGKLSPDTQYWLGVEQGRSDNKLPSLTAKISQKYAGDQGVVTARAMAQETRARLLDGTGKEYNDQSEFGWGVGVGTKYKLNDQLSLSADYSHIKGDDKFITFTDGMVYNAKADKKSIELIEYNAVTAGVTYKFAPQWRTNLGFGAIYFDKQLAGQNKTLQQGWVNVLYNPVKAITLGVEYDYGERLVENYSMKDKAGNTLVRDRTGRDSRLGVMAKYDF